MSEREVRLERLHPRELHAAMAEAPVAYVPWGAIEYHAEHLPFGTDGFSAHRVVEAAAKKAGGVVLPWTYSTIGTLHLEWSFRYDAELVAGLIRETLLQLSENGVRVAVVHTGHGPLDLAHLIKRVCAEVEASEATPEDFRAYGLCYVELNAALGRGLGTDWPAAIDHGTVIETSWVQAMEPDLVHLDRLPEDPEATGIVGIYGPNPRYRDEGARGAAEIEAAADLLAERVRTLLGGGEVDPMADLRTFVERYWPEELEVRGRSGPGGEAAVSVTNPGPVSRYLTSIGVSLDGQTLDPSALRLHNPTIGETDEVFAGDALSPEVGFYVRRQQTAEVTTARRRSTPGAGMRSSSMSGLARRDSRAAYDRHDRLRHDAATVGR